MAANENPLLTHRVAFRRSVITHSKSDTNGEQEDLTIALGLCSTVNPSGLCTLIEMFLEMNEGAADFRDGSKGGFGVGDGAVVELEELSEFFFFEL